MVHRPPRDDVEEHLLGLPSGLVEVLDLGARGLLTPRITRYSLDDGVQAYQDLAVGRVDGRAVVIP